jgi:hypothetical protein
MAGPSESLSETAPLASLLPTQVTIGIREMEFRRERWRKKHRAEARQYLIRHKIPVVKGPQAALFIIDRHHLARALREEGVTDVPVSIVADMSTVTSAEFWTELEKRNWTHPFDDRGERRSYADMPKSLDDLIDDPFRSLAGSVKRAGGYAKDKAPFSEFRWTDFFRSVIDRDLVERNFDEAVALAVKLARSPSAASLPGYRVSLGTNFEMQSAPL